MIVKRIDNAYSSKKLSLTILLPWWTSFNHLVLRGCVLSVKSPTSLPFLRTHASEERVSLVRGNADIWLKSIGISARAVTKITAESGFTGVDAFAHDRLRDRHLFDARLRSIMDAGELTTMEANTLRAAMDDLLVSWWRSDLRVSIFFFPFSFALCCLCWILSPIVRMSTSENQNHERMFA